jgi:hypothetical protein
MANRIRFLWWALWHPFDYGYLYGSRCAEEELWRELRD